MVYEIARRAFTRFTYDGGNRFPLWTPDGKRIAYISRKAASPSYELFWKLADGSGSEEKLSSSTQRLGAITPLPCRRVAMCWPSQTAAKSGCFPLGRPQAATFLSVTLQRKRPTFSPDGHWLAYVSDESGRPEVYVQPFPGPGARCRSQQGRAAARSGHTVGEKCFTADGDRMMAVQVNNSTHVQCSKTQLFLTDHTFGRLAPLVNSYDVSPNGNQFVMIKQRHGRAARDRNQRGAELV